MKVIKADGTKEEFDDKKIVKTCIRSGASKKVAEEIARIIKSNVRENTTTHEIYKTILSELEKREDKSSLLFRLREAVTNLDSESFELYIKKVLEANSYKCEWNKKIKGLYVEHQVDIVAKEGKTDAKQTDALRVFISPASSSSSKLFLVECKRHVNPHRYTGLNICLQVQARLEDINDGFAHKKNSYKLDHAWLITNGKFSDHAKMYAKGRGIRLTGWRYEDRFSLENLIQEKSIFPITLLKIDAPTAKSLLGKKIITINDLLASKISKEKRFKNLVEQSKMLS